MKPETLEIKFAELSEEDLRQIEGGTPLHVAGGVIAAGAALVAVFKVGYDIGKDLAENANEADDTKDTREAPACAC